MASTVLREYVQQRAAAEEKALKASSKHEEVYKHIGVFVKEIVDKVRPAECPVKLPLTVNSVDCQVFAQQ